MRKALFAMAFTLAPISATAGSMDDAVRALLDAAYVEDPRFAIGLAYSVNGDPPVSQTVGQRHLQSTEDVPLNAAWHIGSITKSFTATLVMQQVEAGALDLDAAVVEYLSQYSEEMNAGWQAATLRQLLSHTAGLPPNASTVRLLRPETDPQADRLNVLRELWTRRPPGEPGDFTYSNIGYVFAGLVLEEVTGDTWSTLVNREIAEPLGLTTLGFGAPDGPNDPLGHYEIAAWMQPAFPDSLFRTDNPAWMGPAGTLHMSLADLVTWGKAHISACRGDAGSIITEQSCSAMQTVVANEYGLGWVIQENPQDQSRLVWHNGSNTLWYAVLMIAPDDDIVVAVATNTAEGDRIDALARAALTTLRTSLEETSR